MMLSFIAAASLLLCSCERPADAPDTGSGTISFDRETIEVSSSATTQTLNVSSDCDWGVSSEDSGWLTVSPSGGIAGTTALKVSIAENTGADARESALVFRYGSRSKSLPVRQNYRIEEVAISDPAFKAYLLSAFDADGDGVLSTKEASAISEIKASGLGIKAMPEISTAFPGLTSLDCSGNELSELDLAGMTGLVRLDCSDNNLTNLDIRDLYNLEYFDAGGNPGLTEILVWSGFEAGENFTKPGGARYVEPEIETPLGYTLVWQDEFNSAGSSLPDTEKWWYEIAEPGWVNNELQTYIAGQKGDIVTAEISDGTLKIRAIKDGNRVYSARINTTDYWTYGYFEARLKLPAGLGTWPAFWMMPQESGSWPGCGEMDIMEHVGADLNEVSSSIHCQAYYHAINTQKTAARHLDGATEEFHVYALEWTEECVRTYVDGVLLLEYNPDDYPLGRNEDTWPFHKAFGLKLNLAWGGDWGGYKGVDESCLPQTFEIDYVRVFQKNR